MLIRRGDIQLPRRSSGVRIEVLVVLTIIAILMMMLLGLLERVNPREYNEGMQPLGSTPAKHAGGRPSEYKAEFVAKADEYLKSCEDLRENGELKVKLPKIEGFALYLGVSKQSLYTWAEQHPELLDALEKIKAVQKEKLIDNGLSGAYNSTIAKLVLSSDHDMREKSETGITVKKDGATALADALMSGSVVSSSGVNPKSPRE